MALWPQLGPDDPHQYDLDRTFARATTDREFNLKTGEWEPLPISTTRPLLRIVCSHPGHRKNRAPMLAELWNSDKGPFFLSRLPGAALDPPDHPTDPFAPPTAVLPKEAMAARRALTGRGRPDPQWQPIPVTVVRLLLDEPHTAQASLWVKCADHGVATVDRLLLKREYTQDQQRRRRRDRPRPAVIGLHDVVAVSSA